jgi:hypothetical protein
MRERAPFRSKKMAPPIMKKTYISPKFTMFKNLYLGQKNCSNVMNETKSESA